MINVVLPIFAIILCGYIANRFSLIPASGTKTLNTYVYYFALPAILFISLATAPVSEITNYSFILANVIVILGGMVTAVLIFMLVFKKRFSKGILYGMASSYGNTGFLGIPLLIAAFGQAAAIPAAIATFMYDLLIVTLVIISFEISRHSQKAVKSSANIKSIVKAVFLNPVNVSLMLGIIFAFIQVEVPQAATVFFDTLGSAAGPTALFALGLGLVSEKGAFKKVTIKSAELSTIIGLKLIFQPILAYVLVLFVFPLDDLWAISLVILSALPTGAVANVFAERYNTLVKEMPKWILWCTVTSILTLSIFLLMINGL